MLVESFAHGFGRITEILSNNGIVVKYKHIEIAYCVENAIKYLTFHKEEE
jgi:hypothetical protein